MRILVTRPGEEGEALAERLSGLGHQPLLEPLLEIRFREGPPLDPAGAQAILLTSRNGARALARRMTGRALPVLAVGDSTAEAARALGFATVFSAGGNVDDLARLVQARLRPEAGRLLHPAASVTAGDLAGQLEAAGFQVCREVLYEAVPATALSSECVAALGQGRLDAAVFFSPRTGTTFVRLARSAQLEPAFRRIVALALSPAVKAAVEGLPWRAVEAAARPVEAAMLDLVAVWAPRLGPDPERPTPSP